MPIIKDRFGDKIKTNVISNEVLEIKKWIKERNKEQGKIYEYKVDHTITTLHRKGQWINPNRISILNKPKEKHKYDEDWNNREQMPAIDQQRMVVERLMKDPGQEIRLRTIKHAEKDMKLYTPRVFRNEGGNLMSSIAGAGCNKFHEFRQIRRNDRDREKFFAYLREKEERENREKAKAKAARDANERKLQRNRRKRTKETKNINNNIARAKATKLAAQNISNMKNVNYMLKKNLGTKKSKEQVVIEIDIEPSEVQSGSKLPEEIQEKVEENYADDNYDPDDSYDEDADDGLPPVEMRKKIKF